MMHSLIERHPPSTILRAEAKHRDLAHNKISLPPRGSLWLQISKHPLVMPYNRLAVLTFIINVIIFGILTSGTFVGSAISEKMILNFTLANFATAILIRQQHVINLLFKIATSAPHSWPIKVRWALGKVYHFGGIHVGTFFSGTLWYSLYVLALYRGASSTMGFLFPLACVHLVILSAMIVMALPAIRAKYHNQFEIVARFGSWASLLIFWTQTTLLIAQKSHNGLAAALIRSPHIWILCLLTFSVALPWLRLRKVPVHFTKPSSHVVFADFDYGVTPFAGSSTDLSRNPLLEWHSFANIPIPNREGFQLTISRAGDWTGRLIDDLPTHIWVKGVPTAGVGNIEKLFKKVVWVTTGSGIGPCLPHLFANEVPSVLVWSTRNPHKTYGNEVVGEILRVQPNAVIWDTDKDGKPDLSALAYEAYKNSGAEAVICIANKKVTWKVVYEMESRGIPAFGAIWDS
jgi:hypothetical protein